MLDNDCAHTDMMIYNLERDLDREIERALEESDNNSSDDQEEVPSTTSVPAWIRSLLCAIFVSIFAVLKCCTTCPGFPRGRT